MIGQTTTSSHHGTTAVLEVPLAGSIDRLKNPESSTRGIIADNWPAIGLPTVIDERLYTHLYYQ